MDHLFSPFMDPLIGPFMDPLRWPFMHPLLVAIMDPLKNSNGSIYGPLNGPKNKVSKETKCPKGFENMKSEEISVRGVRKHPYLPQGCNFGVWNQGSEKSKCTLKLNVHFKLFVLQYGAPRWPFMDPSLMGPFMDPLLVPIMDPLMRPFMDPIMGPIVNYGPLIKP